MPKSYTNRRRETLSTTEDESNQLPEEITLENLNELAEQQLALTSYDRIPEAILSGLKRYAETGCPVGGFLEAAISNDFLLAVGKADLWSMRALPAIAAWIYQEMPPDAHGSRKVYKAWVRYHAAQRALLESRDGQDEMVAATEALKTARRESRE
jgi:hypothetical protein